jgi:hypothetical protein
MNKLMKTAAVALVLAMVAFGPTAAIAAPHTNSYSPVASGTHFGFFQILMQFLGFGSSSPVQGGTTVTPSSGGASYSTDGAIWGGGGCRQLGLC